MKIETGQTSAAPMKASRSEADTEYDDLDRRLMDTFPASDPIARYQGLPGAGPA